MGLIILAALLGLFGGRGPLTATSAEGQGPVPFELEYHRFDRFKAPTMLRVRLEEGTGSDTLRLWLVRRYLSRFQVQSVQPQPDGVEASPDWLVYSFVVADPEAPVEVVFNLTAEAFGPLTGRVGLDRSSPLEFKQFIYP